MPHTGSWGPRGPSTRAQPWEGTSDTRLLQLLEAGEDPSLFLLSPPPTSFKQ